MSFCSFFCHFGHSVVCPFSIYGFWLPSWYLQTVTEYRWWLHICDVITTEYRWWPHICDVITTECSWWPHICDVITTECSWWPLICDVIKTECSWWPHICDVITTEYRWWLHIFDVITTEYRWWLHICDVITNNFFFIYTTGSTGRAGTVFPSWAHEFTVGLSRFLVADYVGYVLFCGRLFLFCPFFFIIALPVLRFTASGYPFSIFKLFLKLIPFIDQDEISRSILYMQICICPSTQNLIGGMTGAPNKGQVFDFLMH
jgi:hypothetical protein